MKGSDHVLISILSLALLLVPVVGDLPLSWIAAIAVGLGIGSLAPDADANDAAILHANRRRPLSAVVPIVGYAIRYLCYYPLALALRICRGEADACRHRGVLHTIPGTAAAGIFVTGGLTAVMLFFTLDLYPILPLAGSAFTAGALLHLLEDTCTVSGVAWGYPFKHDRFCGTIRIGDAWDIRPKVYEGLLAASVAGLAIAPSIRPYARPWLPLTGVVLLCALWIIFVTASGVRCRDSIRADARKTLHL